MRSNLMKSQVFSNIEDSNYFVDLFGVRYYFSSESYKLKFKKRVFDYIKDETIKIKNKYQIKININEYLAVSLYHKIEKRGFRIYRIENGKETTRMKETDTLYYEQLE